MPAVFLSYRRADSASAAGRLYDRLVERYGRAAIFKDVDSIPPGARFANYIEESIRASDVAVVMIGPHWLDASAGFGRRRLDDPNDFVRLEVETALKLGVPVIPVLVDGASLPPARRLPPSLRPLLEQNAVALRPDPDFSHDFDRLAHAVDYWQAQPRRPAPAVSLPEAPATTSPTPAATRSAFPATAQAAGRPAGIAAKPVGSATRQKQPRKQRTWRLSRGAPALGGSAVIVALVVALIIAVLHGLNLGAGGSGTRTGGSSSASGLYGAARGCEKVGFLLPESGSSTRWESDDRPDMVASMKKYLPNAHLDVINANGSATTQLSQAESFLTKGDCILIVAPHDSTAAATIVEKALAQHVPVIAYDRLIQDKNTAYYVSFNQVQVGQIQGQYIADHYQSYITANGNNNLVMIDGSQTDDSAVIFKQGAHSALDPLITSGKLNKVYEQYTPNWDNSTAETEMQAALTQTGNKVAIAYVANDDMAGAVIAALQQANLAGKVLVTGQDATAVGIHNILLGNQSMTVYKAIAKEANAAAQLAAALSVGNSTASLTNGATTATQDGGKLPSVLETPVAVDKTNIASTVLTDGYVTRSEVCANVPAGTDGVC